jgi:hypothetical protein
VHNQPVKRRGLCACWLIKIRIIQNNEKRHTYGIDINPPSLRDALFKEELEGLMLRVLLDMEEVEGQGTGVSVVKQLSLFFVGKFAKD